MMQDACGVVAKSTTLRGAISIVAIAALSGQLDTSCPSWIENVVLIL